MAAVDARGALHGRAAVACGALATFALVRALTGGDALPALAGVLYAGPLLFQVHTDGSQGLLAGVAVLAAIAAACVARLERPSWRGTVLIGVLLAGLQAVYPELFPVGAASIAAGVGVRLIGSVRRGEGVAALRDGAAQCAALAALALLASPRTAVWLLGYVYGQVADKTVDLAPLVPYNMELRFLPGWVAGYGTSTGSPSRTLRASGSSPGDPRPGRDGRTRCCRCQDGPPRVDPAAAPWHRDPPGAGRRRVSGLVLTARSAVARARRPSRPRCSAVGLTAGRPRRIAVRAGARHSLAVVAVGTALTLRTQERRVVAGGWLASPDTTAIADAVGRLPGSAVVHLDGLGSVPLWGWAELPTTYEAVQQAGDRRVSVAAEFNEWGGLAYHVPRPREHPAYTPDYDYVLTRFGALSQRPRDRRARRPAGAAAPRAALRRQRRRRGRGGHLPPRPGWNAFVQPPGRQLGFEQQPLTFYVSAQGREPAYLRLTLEGAAPDLRLDAPGARQGAPAAGRLEACLPVPGTGPLRVAHADGEPPARAAARASRPGRSRAARRQGRAARRRARDGRALLARSARGTRRASASASGVPIS